MPIHKVFESASTLLSEFQQKLPIRGPKPKPVPTRWKPPAPGKMKANFVGAVFANSGEAGGGVVIQNENGEVMAALSEKIALPSSVEAWFSTCYF